MRPRGTNSSNRSVPQAYLQECVYSSKSASNRIGAFSLKGRSTPCGRQPTFSTAPSRGKKNREVMR
jgi:hypothetical protein